MPPSPTPSPAADAPGPARLKPLIAALERGLLQRDAAVRLALLAALGGEHVLLIGPPGTAKSALARRLHRVIAGAGYFERLLTRFSTPEELFGPLSLKALEEDRYERLTTGFLPTAGIAFLDEVFKANSAILNALLTLLNEREFDNGSGRVRTPLVSVIGASNEAPADEALEAFFDRFLLRVPVAPVDDAAFEALLQLQDEGTDEAAAAAPAPIEPAERAALQAAAARVVLSPEALAGCHALRAWLREARLALSDRRWRQWMGLMRLAAATEGRQQVDALDLWLAPHVIAAQPDEVQRLADWVQHALVQATPQEVPGFGRAVEAFERQLEIEQQARSDAQAADDAGKLALARAIGRGSAGGDGAAASDPLRILSATLEERQRRRYSPVHIAARLAEIDGLAGRLAARRDAEQARADALADRLADRIWLPPTLGARWLAALAQTVAVLQALMDRLDQARAGFAALPVDLEGPEGAPAPVALPPLEPALEAPAFGASALGASALGASALGAPADGGPAAAQADAAALPG